MYRFRFFTAVTAMAMGANLLVLPGCYARPRSKAVTVTRIDERSTQDLSGHWNNNDSRIVADKIGQEMQTWCANTFTQYQLKANRKPYLIIQKVRNRTMEHIDTSVFMQEIQRALLQAGNVSFVADARERHQLDSERRYQDMNASEESRKEKGSEIGADFAISGEITAEEDRSVDRRVGTVETVYRITIKVSDILTNEIVWSGGTTIAKRVQRAKSTW